MADLCRSRSIRFTVVVLSTGSHPAELVPFARAQGIDVLDCDRPLGRDELVGGVGHPNGRAQAAWGECVAAGLADARPRQPAN